MRPGRPRRGPGSAASLLVTIEGDAALIGPLTLPGRPGCAECARQRLAAAAEGGREGAAGEAPDGDAAPTARASGGVARDLRQALALVARPLAKGADPARSPLVGHVLALGPGGVGLHRVVPLSRCPVCGGVAPGPVEIVEAVDAPGAAGAAAVHPPPHPATPLDPAQPPERLLAALAGWVDPLTGVVPTLTVEREPDLPVVVTAAPPHVLAPEGLRRLPVGWGKGLTLPAAILSAVGEAVERYSASLPDPARIAWAPPDELPGAGRAGGVLDPRELPGPAAAQYARPGFPYAPFDPTLAHPWVCGRWLASGEPVWVPAILVFLSLRVRPEHVFCGGTSNGLAAGPSAEAAAARAVLELIERDALLAAWSTGRPGRPIAWDAETEGELDALGAATGEPRLGVRLRRVRDNVAALGASVTLVDLTTGVAGTTVLALARGDGRTFPGAALGLGCSLDPAAALRSALLELGQTAPFLARGLRSGDLRVPGRPEEVRVLLDHAAWFFSAERARAFDRLVGPDAPAPLARGTPRRPDSLTALRATLDAAGVRVALVHVTAPDVATGPFRVARAVSPDLQPLTHGYGLDAEPTPRIRALGLDPERPPITPVW